MEKVLIQDLRKESALLIGGLRQAVTGSRISLPTDVDWRAFYQLAVNHRVTALVWNGLQHSPEVLQQMPELLQKKFSADNFQTIYRDTQLEYIKENLCKALENAQVPYMLLKGARLKYDYPVPELRTMCDMDILVNTDDYETITEVAKSIGGQPYYGDGNHHNFSFAGNVAVEFHPNLVHPGIPYGTQMNPGWQYAENNEAGFRKEMTPEGMYLHTLCHLAGHFVAGGVGVRFVLDVWVCNHRSKPYDRAFVVEELKRFELLEFAEKIEALSEMWFGQGESTPVLEELGEYILSSGSHGTSDRAMLNAVSLSPGGSKLSALWHKVFYPREELETRYPWAKGRPWLLPAAWVGRAYGAVTKRSHLIKKWNEGTGEVSKEAARQQRDKLASFGITRKKDRKE